MRAMSSTAHSVSGVRSFDSSPMYGGAEETLGAALDGRRSGADVATKIWTPSVEEGRRQYEAQRGFFGRVEIEQVHNLVAWRRAPAVARGGTRRRPYRPDRRHPLERRLVRRARAGPAKRPLRHRAAAAQPGRARGERRLLPLAEELGIAVIVMRPFGGTGAPLLRRAPSDDDLAPLATSASRPGRRRSSSGSSPTRASISSSRRPPVRSARRRTPQPARRRGSAPTNARTSSNSPVSEPISSRAPCGSASRRRSSRRSTASR